MQRVTTAALTVLMAFSLMLSLSTTASANALTGGGYSSSYSGESVFTNQPAGGSGQFSAIFFNDGTQSWAPGVVGLLVCAADKTTCNVASPNAAYASGWTSATVYATVSATVAPGSNGFFVYNFVVPAGTAAGTTATFNGDVGLIATGSELRPQGYFQINTTPGATGALTISPTSASMPIGGQQQFTVSGAPTGSTTTYSVTGGCGAVTQAGLFVATATNSPTQPCTVVASAGGTSASATITVYGSATKIVCSATPATIANDGSTVVVKGTLQDVNGNVVANDNSTQVTYANNTPSLVTPTASAAVSASSGVSSKTYTSVGNGVAGTANISLSSGSLTGCSQTVTLTAPGTATTLAASFYPGTISADGTSTAVLEVDVTDANGTVVVTDNTTTITVSRDSGASVCNIAGAGSGGPTAVSGGSAFFTITSTSTPGTCGWTATANNTALTSSTATLTTVLTGAANKLAVAGSGSPKPADGVSTLRITVALQDASGNRITTPASQVNVTATLGTGCTGTKADGTSGTVVIASDSQSSSAVGQATTGTFSALSGASTGLARFILTSNFATAGCTVTFKDGSTVTSTTSTAVFTAGGPADVACVFTPNQIVGNGSSTSNGAASMVDAQGNLSPAGTFSVSFSKSGTATTLLTSSPQNTSNGVANFTVQSTANGTYGTDTYTATTTVNGASQTGTCTVSVQATIP